ncbi:MAG: bifunctional folylpolyglutamate synthase/dihydrofolate synthase [Geodermatophilaceae bacterium]|nr:bifunctional folylpolyglutamate synthase/dihydrofolate synthase [Geodermatophilaceae bacterium]
MAGVTVTPPVDELARVEAQLRPRWPETRLEPSLTRIAALMEVLGDPQRGYPVVQITGTNGKTSTARMIDELLRGFGLRVGRFTSPHLASITERISVDGVQLPASRFAEVYDDVAPYLGMVDARQPIALSYFEVLTALGYVAFADAPVDVAVVEVGMGGLWDSTSVADAQVAVVTPIALDHMHYLGDDVGSIATEKAGIIKAGAIAVLAQQPADALDALLRRSVQMDATVAREGMEFGLVERRIAVGGQLLAVQGLGGSYDEVFLPLHGAHQAQNAAVALAAVEAFFGAGAQGRIDVNTVRAAFASVRTPGRLEAVRSAPTVLVDAAHNPAGVAATVAAVQEAFDFRRLVAVMACMADKDVRRMLEILEPVVDELVVTANSSPRSMAPDDLAALAVEVLGPERVTVEVRLDDALDTAVRLAEEGAAALSGSGILVIGSVVTAGEARVLLVGR